MESHKGRTALRPAAESHTLAFCIFNLSRRDDDQALLMQSVRSPLSLRHFLGLGKPILHVNSVTAVIRETCFGKRHLYGFGTRDGEQWEYR